jgi:hypothetical protein
LDPVVAAWRRGEPRHGIALVDLTTAVPAATTFNAIVGEVVGTATTAAPPTAAAPSARPVPLPAPAAVDVAPPAFGTAQAPRALRPAAPPLAAAPAPQAAPAPAPPPTLPRLIPVLSVTPLPVDPLVWLLLPAATALLVALCRAVSSAADLEAVA